MAGKIVDQLPEPSQYYVSELRVTRYGYASIPEVWDEFTQWVGAHFADSDGIPARM